MNKQGIDYILELASAEVSAQNWGAVKNSTSTEKNINKTVT